MTGSLVLTVYVLSFTQNLQKCPLLWFIKDTSMIHINVGMKNTTCSVRHEKWKMLVWIHDKKNQWFISFLVWNIQLVVFVMKNEKCFFEFIIRKKNQWFISTLVWNIQLVVSVIHWFQIDICPHSACHLSECQVRKNKTKNTTELYKERRYQL